MKALRFYIQQHRSRNLHFDFRLEIQDVLKSWVIPKGPSLNPADKRYCMLVADHDLNYGPFEGVIPTGEYGAGPVMLWDAGTYDFVAEARNKKEAPPKNIWEAFQNGALKFVLHGQKCRGRWGLIRIQQKGDPWLLVKDRDDFADREIDLIEAKPYSVKTFRTLEQIEEQDQKIHPNSGAS